MTTFQHTSRPDSEAGDRAATGSARMSETSARDQGRDRARDGAMSVAAMSSERIEPDDNVWTRRLVLFLRVMAVISIMKGLYHWAQVTGFIGGEEEAFENQSMAWQTATVYFAVIELVAAVGLWLATPWGAVVWLTTVVSMAVIELMFPGIYGGSLVVVGARGRDAGGLSRAGVDGRARTTAVAGGRRSRHAIRWPAFAVASQRQLHGMRPASSICLFVCAQ